MFKRLERVKKRAKRFLGHSEMTVALLYPDSLSLKYFIQQARIDGLETYTLLPFKIPLDKDEKWQLPKRAFEVSEAMIFLIDSRAESDIKRLREILWERVLWDPKTKGLPLVVGMLDSDMPGALSTAEIEEYFSLVRLTDRFWNVVEMGEIREISHAIDWLKEIVPISGRLNWDVKRDIVEEDQIEVRALLEAAKSGSSSP